MAAAAATTATNESSPQKEMVKHKLELPPKFNGEDSNYEFEAFIKRLRNYLCIHESDYSPLFDYFKKDNFEKRAITTAHCHEMDFRLALTTGTTARLQKETKDPQRKNCQC